MLVLRSTTNQKSSKYDRNNIIIQYFFYLKAKEAPQQKSQARYRKIKHPTNKMDVVLHELIASRALRKSQNKKAPRPYTSKHQPNPTLQVCTRSLLPKGTLTNSLVAETAGKTTPTK